MAAYGYLWPFEALWPLMAPWPFELLGAFLAPSGLLNGSYGLWPFEVLWAFMAPLWPLMALMAL